MFRLISQDGSFEVPYENSTLRLSYRKVDDDNDEDENQSSKKVARVTTQANTNTSKKYYTIDLYLSDYEDSPIMMANYNKDKYRSYVINEIRKKYKEYVRANRGEMKYPDTIINSEINMLKNDMMDIEPYYQIPTNDEIAKKLEPELYQ